MARIDHVRELLSQRADIVELEVQYRGGEIEKFNVDEDNGGASAEQLESFIQSIDWDRVKEVEIEYANEEEYELDFEELEDDDYDGADDEDDDEDDDDEDDRDEDEDEDDNDGAEGLIAGDEDDNEDEEDDEDEEDSDI